MIGIPGLGGFEDIIITGGLTALGTKLKNKDANNTGADDVGGNMLIAMAPVIPAILHGDIKTQRTVATAARDALDKYINSLPNA